MNWLKRIHNDHQNIVKAFEEVLNCNDKKRIGECLVALRELLVSHFDAEELTVYKCLEDHKLKTEAHKLWSEQSQANIMDADLNRIEDVKTIHVCAKHLMEEVVHHAEVEEKVVFPKLQKALSPRENEELTKQYIQHYKN